MSTAAGQVGSGIPAQRLRLMERAVKQWVSQLMDLTGRNQLLYYKTLKRGTVELTDAAPGPLDMLLSGRTVRLSQLLPDTEEHPGRLSDALARAQTVHKKALALFEERGIQTLYLAWGMATWTTSTSGATPCAPVLLRPMQFKPRGAAEADFDVALDGDWDVNATLLHLLAHDYKLHVDPRSLLDLMQAAPAGAPDPDSLFERLIKEASDVDEFQIVPRVVAGTFTYTKLPMVQDLQGAIEQLATHDLIAAVAGDDDAVAAVRALHARDVDATLPDNIPPADEFLILDADASQSYAINAAVAGEPLVIIGPPGTGKSQTIANLISSYTARGMKVLFVAEKRAAIDAVTKRLHARGLDDLVMDLHGGAKSKRQLAADLAAALERLGQVAAVDVADIHRSLTESRNTLNEHAAALHQPRAPWNLSLWQVLDRLTAVPARARGNMQFASAALMRLDSDTAPRAREALQEWADLAQPMREHRSLWAGAAVTTETDAQRAHQVAVHLAGDAVPAARSLLESVLTTTGLRAPDSVASWRATFELLNGLTAVLAVLKPEVWEQNLDALSLALASGGRSAWARMIAQLFSSDYRAAKRTVTELWRGVGKPDGRQAHAAVTAARDNQAQWNAVGGSGTPLVPHNLEAAGAAYQAVTNDLSALGAYLAYDLSARTHHTIAADAEHLASDQATIFRLPKLHALRTWLSEHGCAPLLDAVDRGVLDADDVVAAFDHAWLTSIRAHVTATDPRLASFDGKGHMRRVDQFVTSDRQHIETTAMRVRRRVAEQGVAALDAFDGQARTVLAESKKKRRQLTLRQLFDAAPDVLTSLRPCWVMSPLVVSQTLPAEPIFDVVIFDEASQVTPADAVPALLRARQAVVAGDDRQLPPTAFFGMVEDDEEEEVDEDAVAGSLASGYESVLDVLSVLLRQYMLTWHYRSEDDRLIAFSNVNLYGLSLTTFPGIAGSTCLAHELIPHRPGVKVDSRSNDDEVARVVELMIEHARSRPHESLGVIAMGIHHANRIEALLRSRIAEERDARLEEFFDESVEERAFVKNLERVQGDERDAIILSIGYAKNPDGRMVYRFGPLNAEGGERRLNVAISRARRRLTLVSSFSHTDMEPGRSSAKGAQLLREYLKYVESGGSDLGGAEHAPELNAFELGIQRALERAGLKVIPQYGTGGFRVDFAICHPDCPGEFVMAVEADGAAYHGSQTARDRDRLRQQILERLGWSFHRIWSTDWFNDPQRETQKVVVAYKAALAAEKNKRALPIRPKSPSAVNASPPSETPLAPVAGKLRTAPKPHVRRGMPITEYRHDQLVALARWIKSDTLLRTEEQMLAEMMEELGFNRRGSRIVNALSRAIESAR